MHHIRGNQLGHCVLLRGRLNVEWLLVLLVKLVLSVHVEVVLEGAASCAAGLVGDFKPLIMHLNSLQGQVTKRLIRHLK